MLAQSGEGLSKFGADPSVEQRLWLVAGMLGYQPQDVGVSRDKEQSWLRAELPGTQREGRQEPSRDPVSSPSGGGAANEYRIDAA